MALDRRHSYEISQMGDNTYATILPRNVPQIGGSGSNSTGDVLGVGPLGNSRSDLADYATLRNDNRLPPPVSVMRFLTKIN